MHIVGILALPGVVPFDLAVPCDVFERVRTQDGAKPYDVRVCGLTHRVRSLPYDIHVDRLLNDLTYADTIIVPGTEDNEQPAPPEALEALTKAATCGTRIASICSGAFTLAEAGLLDGRRATTHWLATAALAARHPEIEVDPDVLFVDEGPIITSAGASAGIDMCLHLIARDLGHAVAAEASRRAVAPLGREGGQRQFILHTTPERRLAGGDISEALEWIESRLDRPISVDQMAAQVGMSPRTFARRFVQDTGTTPRQWLIEARMRRARLLLENTELAVDEVAERSGFADASGLRDRFRRELGVSPRRYRASFGTRARGAK